MNNSTFLWVMVVTLIAACLYIFWTTPSPAHWENVAEIWKGYNITPEQKEAIRRAKVPGHVECCGTADGIPVDFDIKNGHYWANWDGGWRQIPDELVLKEMSAPVHFPILWVTGANKFIDGQDQHYRDVRCFWPGAGG